LNKIDELFLSSLKNAFKSVINSSNSHSVEEIRSLSSKKIQEAFSKTKYEIHGSENLPSKGNLIFIYNHLNNHPLYSVAENFQITLDSHFISSMVIDRYYNNPGIRVSRLSLPNEKFHKHYYDKLDYIRVYAKNFIPKNITDTQVKSINQKFYKKASKYLKKGNCLVLSPEGASYSTEESPGVFKKGLFKLLSKLSIPTTVVPIVTLNFDKLASKSIFKCEIKKPIEYKSNLSNNDIEIESSKLNKKYKSWVNKMKLYDHDFSFEIKNLLSKVEENKNMEAPIIFYGSSTIRLWKSLNEDFKDVDLINLGFGGAYIDSLSKNFNLLIKFLNPKAIVIYLGGNDLNLSLSPEEIIFKIKKFVQKINKKYPNTNIGYITIKPSVERKNKLSDIKKINKGVKLIANNFPNLVYIDVYNKLLDKGEVTSKFLLQDGLHLNKKGYKVLTRAVKEKIKI
tara:strand:+ start:1711 stop:3069 length:1359 start_codon:yes stop_codon:yes gene_type:complete